MNEFEKQLIENMAKKTAEFAKERADEITKPTSKSIGDNLGLMVDGVFGWLGTWGQIQKEKQLKYIEDYKQKLYSKIEEIPSQDLIEPCINIVGPALESSKYYFAEDYYQEMFANLIAASCNNKQKSKVHPSYIEIIKQLSPLDAKVLNLFKYHSTYPIAELKAINKDKTISPFPLILCDFKEQNKYFSEEEFININSTIENLERLKLILKNREVIELSYDYSKFKSNFLYKVFESSKGQNAIINIIKYRIELTAYGERFFDICKTI